MNEDQLKSIIESEQEWRRYTVKKLEGLEKELDTFKRDLHIFKIKAFGFITALVAAADVIKTTIFKQ